MYLAVLVDEIFEIVILAEHWFGYQVLVVHTYGGYKWGTGNLRYPGDLSCLFIIRVLQIQTGIQRGYHSTTVSVNQAQKEARFRIGSNLENVNSIHEICPLL